MPKLGRTPAANALSGLLVASALFCPGCGGAKEPETKVKPGWNLSDAEKAEIKDMQSKFPPMKRAESDEAATAKTNGVKKGLTKGVMKKAAPGTTKGVIILK